MRSLWNLWRYTGDRELIQGLLPGAENVLRWFLPYRGENGLVRHVDQWVLVDWAALHHADTSACLNAQWARALPEFAEMSEWLGDAGRAAWARARHAELAAAFELFWDPERDLYVDHVVGGGVTGGGGVGEGGRVSRSLGGSVAVASVGEAVVLRGATGEDGQSQGRRQGAEPGPLILSSKVA